MQHKIYSRTEWKQKIFERDNHQCVNCGNKNIQLDAHHIIERKLFDDGGYYIDNGVSLCAESIDNNSLSCHMQAEGCLILPDQLREKANIKNIILPPNWNKTQQYDKWGNIILSFQQRKPGKNFANEEVQKVLKKCNTIWMYYTT